MAVCPKGGRVLPRAGRKSRADGFGLTGDAAFGWSNARNCGREAPFRGDQSALTTKNSNGEHADIVERLHHPLQIGLRLAFKCRICKRGNAVVQNTAAMGIGRERIEHDVARRGTRAHEGKTSRRTLEISRRSTRNRRSPPTPHRSGLSRVERIGPCVVAQTARFEHAGGSPVCGPHGSIALCVDRGVRRNRNSAV